MLSKNTPKSPKTLNVGGYRPLLIVVLLVNDLVQTILQEVMFVPNLKKTGLNYYISKASGKV